MDKKGIYMDRIYLYYTLCKTPIKREKKGFFLIKKKSDYEWSKIGKYIKKKLKPPPEYDYRAGNYFIREWFFEAERSHLENYVRIRF